MTNPLLNRLSNKEDNFIERKPEGAGSGEFRKTVVAFANSVPEGRTAVLYIGVTDSGEIAGVGNSDKLQKTIREICERECYPPIRFTSEVLSTESKDILAVVIGPSSKRPHFAGPAFVRRGSESVAASEEMLDEMIASRNEKAGRLLAHKGEMITVDFESRLIGGPSIITRPEECKIESASAHSVELRIPASGRGVSIAMERIVITKDVQNHRPLRLKVRIDE